MRLDELFEDDVDYRSLGSRIAKSLFGKYRNPKMKGGSLASGYGMGLKPTSPPAEPQGFKRSITPAAGAQSAPKSKPSGGTTIKVGGVEYVWNGSEWRNSATGETATPAISDAIQSVLSH